MPRHMKIHSENRDKLMHRCPYPECKFENLQKSNVETHIRTHTKTKSERCPDCDFTTVDPGSLTRHRKRIHGYIPKTRRTRQPPPPKSDIVLSAAGPSTTILHNSTIPQDAAVEAYTSDKLPQYNPQPRPPNLQLPSIRYTYQPLPPLPSAASYKCAKSRSRSRTPSPSVSSSSEGEDESDSNSKSRNQLRPVATWS